jgi:hypothetical protein
VRLRGRVPGARHSGTLAANEWVAIIEAGGVGPERVHVEAVRRCAELTQALEDRDEADTHGTISAFDSGPCPRFRTSGRAV